MHVGESSDVVGHMKVNAFCIGLHHAQPLLMPHRLAVSGWFGLGGLLYVGKAGALRNDSNGDRQWLWVGGLDLVASSWLSKSNQCLCSV